MKLKEKMSTDGKIGSPDLKNNIKNYLIDIDGTICEDIPNEEPKRMINAKEILGAKKWVNELYKDGHIITFFTSRTNKHRKDTLTWLENHGFKYHGIIFNKPRGGNYIWLDDKKAKTILFKGKF